MRSTRLPPNVKRVHQQRVWASFDYAFQGILYATRTQINLRARGVQDALKRVIERGPHPLLMDPFDVRRQTRAAHHTQGSSRAPIPPPVSVTSRAREARSRRLG